MGCVEFSIAARRNHRFYGRMAGHAPHPSPHRFRRAAPQPRRSEAACTAFAHLRGGEGERLRSRPRACGPPLAAAEGLALIELEAALELRRSGEKRPILLLQGVFSP